MPFTPTGKGDYTSPSGRHFTGKQVRLYYATDGFTKKPKGPQRKKITHVPSETK